MTVKTLARMLGIDWRVERVSVGWQWASKTPRCHGNGSACFVCSMFVDIRGPQLTKGCSSKSRDSDWREGEKVDVEGLRRTKIGAHRPQLNCFRPLIVVSIQSSPRNHILATAMTSIPSLPIGIVERCILYVEDCEAWTSICTTRTSATN